MLLAVIVFLAAATGAAALAVRFCLVFPRQLRAASSMPDLDADGRALALRLETHIRAVATYPHNVAHPGPLEAAAVYIEQTLRGMGYEPLRQEFPVAGILVRNIEVTIAPHAASPGSQTLVIGAHYDSAGDSPGANDNGTGVACLLELARTLQPLKPARRLRLVFFVNEEAPYGKTPSMGSYQHAKSLRDRGEPVAGMLALETLGYFSQTPGSQRFPFPFGLAYENRGDFVAFVGLLRSRGLVQTLTRAFRAATAFPAIGATAPAFVEGADLSDHWAYDHFGFPACMVTDTASFRNPFYHSQCDTPDTVDYVNLARITAALAATIVTLGRPNPKSRSSGPV